VFLIYFLSGLFMDGWWILKMNLHTMPLAHYHIMKLWND